MSEHKYLTDEERAGIALHLPDIKNLHTRQIAKALLADLIALRAELTAARDRIAELERRGKALEEIDKAMIGTRETALDYICRLKLMALDALNPQPAQYKTPETPWRPSSFFNGYEERINGNGHLETRPMAA